MRKFTEIVPLKTSHINQKLTLDVNLYLAYGINVWMRFYPLSCHWFSDQRLQKTDVTEVTVQWHSFTDLSILFNVQKTIVTSTNLYRQKK